MLLKSDADVAIAGDVDAALREIAIATPGRRAARPGDAGAERARSARGAGGARCARAGHRLDGDEYGLRCRPGDEARRRGFRDQALRARSAPHQGPQPDREARPPM